VPEPSLAAGGCPGRGCCTAPPAVRAGIRRHGPRQPEARFVNAARLRRAPSHRQVRSRPASLAALSIPAWPSARAHRNGRHERTWQCRRLMAVKRPIGRDWTRGVSAPQMLTFRDRHRRSTAVTEQAATPAQCREGRYCCPLPDISARCHPNRPVASAAPATWPRQGISPARRADRGAEVEGTGAGFVWLGQLGWQTINLSSAIRVGPPRSGLLSGCIPGHTGRLPCFTRSAIDQHWVVTPQVLHQTPRPETTSVRPAATTSTTRLEVCCKSSPRSLRCHVMRQAGDPRRTEQGWWADLSVTGQLLPDLPM